MARMAYEETFLERMEAENGLSVAETILSETLPSQLPALAVAM